MTSYVTVISSLTCNLNKSIGAGRVDIEQAVMLPRHSVNALGVAVKAEFSPGEATQRGKSGRVIRCGGHQRFPRAF